MSVPGSPPPVRPLSGIVLERLDAGGAHELLSFARAAAPVVQVGRRPAGGAPPAPGAASWRSAVMSRRHAQLVLGPDEVSVRDLGSHHGTFVAPLGAPAARVLPGTPARLADGAVLTFGKPVAAVDPVSVRVHFEHGPPQAAARVRSGRFGLDDAGAADDDDMSISDASDSEDASSAGSSSPDKDRELEPPRASTPLPDRGQGARQPFALPAFGSLFGRAAPRLPSPIVRSHLRALAGAFDFFAPQLLPPPPRAVIDVDAPAAVIDIDAPEPVIDVDSPEPSFAQDLPDGGLPAQDVADQDAADQDGASDGEAPTDEEEAESDEDTDTPAQALVLRLARTQAVLARVEARLDPLEEVCRDTLGALDALRADERARAAELAALLADARAALAAYPPSGAQKRAREEDAEDAPPSRAKRARAWAGAAARTTLVAGLGAAAAWSALAFA